ADPGVADDPVAAAERLDRLKILGRDPLRVVRAPARLARPSLAVGDVRLGLAAVAAQGDAGGGHRRDSRGCVEASARVSEERGKSPLTETCDSCFIADRHPL